MLFMISNNIAQKAIQQNLLSQVQACISQKGVAIGFGLFPKRPTVPKASTMCVSNILCELRVSETVPYKICLTNLFDSETSEVVLFKSVHPFYRQPICGAHWRANAHQQALRRIGIVTYRDCISLVWSARSSLASSTLHTDRRVPVAPGCRN